MENPSAPQGKSLKYARLERERRFLLARPPETGAMAAVEIVDHYLAGTRLRLRAVLDPA